MQIVLMENIRKLGQVGDVVSVNAGYARNFLIPQKKALRATKENTELFETKRAELEKQSVESEKTAKLLVKKIDGVDINLIRSATESGRLYGSVSAKDIAKLLSEKLGSPISPAMVQIAAPFKEVGLATVQLNLYGDAKTSFRLIIAQSNDEAKLLVTEFEEEKKAEVERLKKEAEIKAQAK
ncbi:MAG: 50S ribosomal protein L9, partial [Alphaproteobacteria bacterium]